MFEDGKMCNVGLHRLRRRPHYARPYSLALDGKKGHQG